MHGKDGRDDWRDNLHDSCSGFVIDMPFEPHKPHNSVKKAAKEGKKKQYKIYKKTSNRYWLLTLMQNVFHF